MSILTQVSEQADLQYRLDIPQQPGPSVQGQGKTTEFKLRGIEAALSVSLRVCAGERLAQYTYWYIDLNAGCGYNHDAGCVGSPLAFRRAAEACGKGNYRAFFCDIRQEAVDELRGLAGNDSRCSFLCADNKMVLPGIAHIIRTRERKPQYAMGTVLCDPNGYFYGSAVPEEGLRRFCEEFPRIDVILNLNVTTRRWIRGCIRGQRKGWEKATCLGLDEIPRFLHREHWLIRTLISKGGHQFVLMIGRNFRMGDHRALGFYHMDSPEGHAIVSRVETTPQKEEL